MKVHGRVAATIALTLCRSAALAQGASAEEARGGLLRDADAARDAGDDPRALDLATRAGRIRMSPSLRLMIAQVYGSLDQPLAAFEQASHCAREAARDPALFDRDTILDVCTAIATVQRQRLGAVIVRIPAQPPADLRVRVQSAVLPATGYGVEHPVVPGRVLVEASSGRGAFRREVEVPRGASVIVDVTLVAPPPPSIGAGPWIVAGAGVAALGSALAFHLLREDALEESLAACQTRQCLPGPFALSRAHYDRADTFNTLTAVALGVGAVAVAGGAVWYLVRRLGRNTTPRAALTWMVTPTPAGVSLGVGGAL